MIRITTLVMCALAAQAMPARAQTIVDEGTFSILSAGTRVGRETFVIRRLAGPPTTAGYQAGGTILYADHRLTPNLTTDANGLPVTFTLDTRTGTLRASRVSAQFSRGRFTLRTQTRSGESAREVVLPPGTVLLSPDIIHEYFFIPLAARQSQVSILDPEQGTQTVQQITDSGPEQISIGGRQLDAHELTITDTHGATRLIWLDSQGRVLRVEIPDRQLVAVRDDPPR